MFSGIKALFFTCCVTLLWVGPALPQAADWEVRNLAGTGRPGFEAKGPALATPINNPFGVITGRDGSVYFCETGSHCLRKIQNGQLSLVAGTGRAGYTGDGASALEARMNEPYEIRFAENGDLYVVEMKNHIVRRIDQKTGIIETVAGTGEPGYSGDGGPATRARLHRPHSIQLKDDRLYICDIGNHRLRVVDLKTGTISTLSGTGEKKNPRDGAAFRGAPLNGPRALDFDRKGNLWLALREGNSVYELDLKSGLMHHRAGTGKKGFTGHGAAARKATLSGPKGISIGPRGNVYLADTESHSVRMIDLETGDLELIAGTGKSGDGPVGNPLECAMARLHGVFVDHDGRIYVGDSEAHRIRIIEPKKSDS
ncbi:MAG: hypothetical protein AAF514_14375 [Verrucomicrobiota bacterium]